MTQRRHRVAGPATALLAALVLAGCATPAKPAVPPTTQPDFSLSAAPATTTPPASAPATAKPKSAAEASVLRSYNGMWSNLMKVSQRPDSGSPLLATYASGRQLAQTRARMTTYARRGVALKGTVHLRPKVDVVVPRIRAIVTDCVDASDWVEAGADPAPSKPDLHIATLEPVRGTWKVVNVTVVRDRC
jgi:hypothetical protein